MNSGADHVRGRRVAAAGTAGTGAVVLVLTFLASASAWASGPLESILACRRIADSAARLTCFDRESAALGNMSRASAPVTSKPRMASSPAVVARDRQSQSAAATATRSTSLDPQRTFGLPPMKILAQEEAAARLPRELDHITAHIAALGRTPDGRAVFTLDNGEVWAQLVPDEDLYAKPGDSVKISKALLGSYWLALQSRRGGCKVTRLQ